MSDFTSGEPGEFPAFPTQPPATPPTVDANQRPVFGTPAPGGPTTPAAPAAPVPLEWSTMSPDTELRPASSETPAEPQSARGKAGWVAAMAAVVLLVGGGAFFAMQAFGATGGAATPDEAVSEMIDAINGEDFLSAAELLEPAERRTIAEPILTEILPELQRLGVIEETMDAGAVGGIDYQLTDITWRLEPIGNADDMQAVYFTGGNAAADIVAADLPWGDAMRDLFGEEIDEIEDSSGSEAVVESDTPMVLVERDGRWYFSLWHSVAESARLAAGSPLPAQVLVPPVLGADTPEAAVEQMVLAMFDGDVRAIIGHLDPDEAAALYRYSPLFLDEIDEAREEALNELDLDLDVSISNLSFTTETDGDDAVVRFTGFTITVTAPDVNVEFIWEPNRVSLDVDVLADGTRFDGTANLTGRELVIRGIADGETIDVTAVLSPDAETVRVTGTAQGEPVEAEVLLSEPCAPYSARIGDEEESGCLDDNPDADIDAALESLNDAFAQFEEGVETLPISVHKTDGRWFVSPTLSVMDPISRALSSVTKEDFDAQIEQFRDTVDTLNLEQVPNSIDGIGGVGGGGDEPVVAIEVPDSQAPEAVEWVEVDRGTVAVTAGTMVQQTVDLADSSYDLYGLTVDAEAGAMVTVTMTVQGTPDGLYDPYIVLRDDLWETLAVNDDASESANLADVLDSQIVIDLAPGSYWFSAESYDGFGGEYEVVITGN